MRQIVLIIILAFPCSIQAQTKVYIDYWDITLHIGPYSSGISRNLNREMQANSFVKPSFFGYGGGSGSLIHNKPIFELALERVTAKSWSFIFLLSSMKGHAAGFSSRYGDLRVEYSQVTAAFLAGYYSRQRITRIAVGPALYFLNVQTAGFSFTSVQQQNTKAGFVIEAGLRFPAKGWLFIDCNSQYQFIGRQDLGTYNFGQRGSMRIGEKPVNLFSFNLGIGVRFDNSQK